MSSLLNHTGDLCFLRDPHNGESRIWVSALTNRKFPGPRYEGADLGKADLGEFGQIRALFGGGPPKTTRRLGFSENNTELKKRCPSSSLENSFLFISSKMGSFGFPFGFHQELAMVSENPGKKHTHTEILGALIGLILWEVRPAAEEHH